MLFNSVSIVLSPIIALFSQQELSQTSSDNLNADARITCILCSAYNRYNECNATISSARRDVAGSRHLFNLATIVMDLVRSAETAPHTNFMPDIAINVLT
ncbi:hypothetical protein AX14_013089, partial [Amanita brunnescens Koide BX004]